VTLFFVSEANNPRDTSSMSPNINTLRAWEKFGPEEDSRLVERCIHCDWFQPVGDGGENSKRLSFVLRLALSAVRMAAFVQESHFR
jgi:hypothetical protein